MTVKNLSQLIGKTPLAELERLGKETGARAKILAKLECFNPLSSAKDRAALFMLNAAENSGKLKKGGTVIESTSGNTGVALAYICSIRGYRLVLTMPESMSSERRSLLSALGAQLVLTPKGEGMAGALKKAEQILVETPGSFMPLQFENPANAQAHRETTGPEIWNDAGGRVDILVAGVGTGGTITGTGEFLKEKNPNIKIVAVEPFESPLLSGGEAAPHGIQGIGANFIPPLLNRAVIDEIICVKTGQAIEYSRIAAKKEGLIIGISSGAALFAASQLAVKEENEGKSIAVILPDTGERYLSGGLYE